MKLLILGGTVFLGRHLVDAALARGHEVTLFNRGQHNPELYPELEQLRGDRDGGLQALAGRRWDAAIDTSGYAPRIVRASAELLAGTVEHYTFISTISVFSDLSHMGIDEDGPMGVLEDETVEEVRGDTYGPLKALSERAAEAAMPGRVLVIRPGLIVGPHDPSGRFTYWPGRVARGGDVLLPGRPGRAVQIIDARDLAEWNVRMAEERRTGVFNATGPERVLTMEAVFAACNRAGGAAATPVWVDEQFLLDAGVTPWTELPLWVPESERMKGFNAIDCRKAIAAGLRFRHVEQTAADTLAWDRRRVERNDAAGMAPEREAELLQAWRERERAGTP